jgi:hypothetical protein
MAIAKAGSYSANWRASFVTWCKRWKEHKDKQAPPRVELSRSAPGRGEPARNSPSWQPTEKDWDGAAKLWASIGRWSGQFGPDPTSRSCRCPKEILERHVTLPPTLIQLH